LLTFYLHRQQAISATINFLLNPALGYVMNWRMRPFAPLEAAIDAVITCLIMGLLIGVLVAPDARRFIRAARLAAAKRGWLGRLPASGWALGLVIGVCGAAVIAPLAYGLPRRHRSLFLSSEPRSNNEPRVPVTPDLANKPVRLRIYVCRAMAGPNATAFSIGSFGHVHGVCRLIFGALEIIRQRFAVIEGQTCRA
jgi:hypothetical protein